MLRRELCSLLAGSVAASTISLRAQDAEDPVFRGGVQAILAPTTVLDKDGNYVHGVRADEFRLFDNGKLQKISVDETFAPISMVVAIQADQKVDAVLPKIRRLGTMLTSLVAGENGEIAVVAFDHRVRDMTNGFTSDPDKVNYALNEIKAGSMNSALTDAVVESTRMLRNRPKDRRKVLLIIAESLDKGSTMKAREALTNLEIANVMVYALNVSRLYTALTTKPAYPRPDPIPPGGRHVPAGGINTPYETARNMGVQGYGANFAPLIEEMYRGVKAVFVSNPIEVFTRYTGGKEYPFVSQEDLERAVQNVSSELHNQYLITYVPTTRSEGGFHNIRVEVTRRGLDVSTRPGYWMAAQQ